MRKLKSNMIRCLSIGFVLAYLACPSRALCDDFTPTKPTRLETPAYLSTSGGSTLDLPAGFFIVPPKSWDDINKERNENQLELVRLKAENKYLLKAIEDTDMSWPYVIGIVITSFMAGSAIGAL